MKTRFKKFIWEYFKFPLFIMLHPFNGYEEFKRYKKGNFNVAIVFIVLFAFFRIFKFQYEGFLINPNNPLTLNSLNEIFRLSFCYSCSRLEIGP